MFAVREICSSNFFSLRHVSRYHRPHIAPESGKPNHDDVYNEKNIADELKIKTHYEELDIAQSKRVHYLQFKINKELPVEKDQELKELFREELS